MLEEHFKEILYEIFRAGDFFSRAGGETYQGIVSTGWSGLIFERGGGYFFLNIKKNWKGVGFFLMM